MTNRQFQFKRVKGLKLPLRMARAFCCATIFFVSLFAMTLRAEEASTIFNEANKFYEQGKFSDAAIAYEKMIQSGSVSTAVYFNLGNAYLKSGQVGRAIAAYRNAESLSPRDPDVRANLQFARDQAGGGTSAQAKLWENWIGKLTLNEWTILTVIAVSIWFLLLAIRQWRADWRRSFRGILLSLGIVCGFLVVCLAVAIHKNFFVQSPVVIVPEAVVRRGPLEESQSAFTLRDGAEVTVLNEKGDWLQITDSSQRTGWLLKRQTMSISEPGR